MKTFKYGSDRLLFAFGIFLASLRILSAEAPLLTDVTILSREDFTGQNFTSVGDALQSLTTIHIAKEGTRGSKITAKMRGAADAKEVLVLLDGKPLNNSSDGAVDLSQIPLNMVERIEITRGGASASYSAQGAAGVINIVTTRPYGEGLLVDLGVGIGRGGVKTSNGRFLGRSNLGDFTYLPSREISGGLQDNNETASTTHFGNISRSFGGKGFWGVEYFSQSSEVELANGTPVRMEDWNGHLEQTASTPFLTSFTDFQQAKIILGSPVIAGGTFYFDALKSWRDAEEKDNRTGYLLSDRKNNSDSIGLKWIRKNFGVGGNLQDDTEERPEAINKFKYQRGAFILNKWESPHWTALPALRYDFLSTGGEMLSPRLAVVFSPDGAWSISSSAQKSFRPPTFEELYFSSNSISNPNLKPEKNVSFDLGFAFISKDRFKIGSTLFYTKAKDLILENPNSNQLSNFGHLESMGAESELSFHFGRKNKFLNFSSFFNWTYQKSQRTRENGLGFVPTQMTPKNLVNMRFVQHLPKRTLIINEVKYQSEQFQYDNEQGMRIPSFTIWNIRIQKKILASTIHLVMENVTGHRCTDNVVSFTDINGNASSALVPQPGRTLWAGISIQFLN